MQFKESKLLLLRQTEVWVDPNFKSIRMASEQYMLDLELVNYRDLQNSSKR